MSINEQHRALAVARELEDRARTLAHSTRSITRPADSYPMLGELHATVRELGQVAQQLARWHRVITDGIEYKGEDPTTGDGATGTVTAAAALDSAAAAFDGAAQALNVAQSANGRVRWVGPSSDD